MSLKGAAAVVGIAELAPQRYTGEATILDLLSQVAGDALDDAGFGREQVDDPIGLAVVHRTQEKRFRLEGNHSSPVRVRSTRSIRRRAPRVRSRRVRARWRAHRVFLDRRPGIRRSHRRAVAARACRRRGPHNASPRGVGAVSGPLPATPDRGNARRAVTRPPPCPPVILPLSDAPLAFA